MPSPQFDDARVPKSCKQCKTDLCEPDPGFDEDQVDPNPNERSYREAEIATTHTCKCYHVCCHEGMPATCWPHEVRLVEVQSCFAEVQVVTRTQFCIKHAAPEAADKAESRIQVRVPKIVPRLEKGQEFVCRRSCTEDMSLRVFAKLVRAGAL